MSSIEKILNGDKMSMVKMPRQECFSSQNPIDESNVDPAVTQFWLKVYAETLAKHADTYKKSRKEGGDDDLKYFANLAEIGHTNESDWTTAQFSRNFLLFYSLLRNQTINRKNPQQQLKQQPQQSALLNGSCGFLSSSWLAKLQESCQTTTEPIQQNLSVSGLHEPPLRTLPYNIKKIRAILNNNNNSCEYAENFHADEAGISQKTVQRKVSQQEIIEDPHVTTNSNFNLRSRELWKKWRMETPYYKMFSSTHRQKSTDFNINEEIEEASANEITEINVATSDESTNADSGFECSRCGKMFSYAYYRDKHLKYTRCVDNGDRKFPCSSCSRSFEKRDRLRIHILHVHENHRPHVCATCGKAFSQSSSLNKHLRVHSGERPYQCPFCTKCFTASSILRTHIRQHSGEKPFKCIFCGKSFASHAAHDSHVRRTHPSGNAIPSQNNTGA